MVQQIWRSGMMSLYEGRLIFASNMRRGGELKDLIEAARFIDVSIRKSHWSFYWEALLMLRGSFVDVTSKLR